MKKRLDVLLVERRLADSREKAKAVIMTMCLSMARERTRPGQPLMRKKHRLKLKVIQ